MATAKTTKKKKAAAKKKDKQPTKITEGVSSVSIKREGKTFTCSWKVPTSLKNGNKKTMKATKLLVGIYRNVKKTDGGFANYSKSHKKKKMHWVSLSSSKTSTNNKLGTSTNWLDIEKYYPNTSTKLMSLGYQIVPGNGSHRGKAARATYTFSVPKNPKCGDISVDTSNDKVTLKCTLEDVSGKSAQRTYVGYEKVIEGSGIKKTSTKGHIRGTGSSAKEFSVSHNFSDIQGLSKDQWRRVTWYFRSYGVAGKNNDRTSKSKTLGHSPVPQIKSVKASTIQAQNRRITVTFSVGSASYVSTHPTTGIRLYVAQSTQKNVTDPSILSWKKTDSVTDYNGGSLSWQPDDKVDLTATGTYTYVRLKAENEYDQLSAWSAVSVVPGLYRQPEDTSGAKSVAVTKVSGGDGDPKSLRVDVAWTDTKYNGTEVSWSEDSEAWHTTKDPDSFQMPDSSWDEGATSEGGVSYKGHAWVKLSSLDESTKYYVRARRYNVDSDTLHTAWCEAKEGTTGASPVGVTAAVPAYVERGRDLMVRFVVGGTNPHTWYEVDVNGNPAVGADSSATVAVVPASAITGDTVKVVVWVMVSGKVYASPEYTVNVKDAPTVTFSDPKRIITEKPFPITMTTQQGVTLSYELTSKGCIGERPAKDEPQYSGDVVWSGDVVAGADPVTIEIPASVDLRDGCDYRLSVTPMDSDGLIGDTVSPTWSATDEEGASYTTADFTVQWAHQAVAPSWSFTDITVTDGIARITPVKPDGYFPTQDETVEEGKTYYRENGEGWYTTATNPTDADLPDLLEFYGYVLPDGYTDTDTFDLYRSTPDADVLISADNPFGRTIVDRWVPFGEDLSYRIATKTPDGDVSWFDYEYENEGDGIRIDWGRGKSVHLTRGVSKDHEHSKDFEEVTYLDGTTEGYWNDGTSAKESMTAYVIEGYDDEAIEALHELEQYSAPCFVRTWDGQAYEADVSVSFEKKSAINPVQEIKLTCKRVNNGVFLGDVAE